MASASAEKLAERHNAEVRAKETPPPAAGHNSGGELKSYLERLVALEQEKASLSEDIRELKAEAKEHDINPRALAVLAKRELEDDEAKAKRVALQDAIDSYSAALGLLL